MLYGGTEKQSVFNCTSFTGLFDLNNDIYASLGCKTVIIETVEREFVQHILSFRDIKDINYTLEKEDNKPENNFTEKKKKESSTILIQEEEDIALKISHCIY